MVELESLKKDIKILKKFIQNHSNYTNSLVAKR